MTAILSADAVAAIADAERLMADTVGLPPAARCGEGDDCACCFCQAAIYAAGYKALRAERDAAMAALARILAQLEALEWRSELTAAGTYNLVCPACHRTPWSVRLNPRTQRPDGHRQATDSRGDLHVCPLATILDEARTALKAATPDA